MTQPTLDFMGGRRQAPKQQTRNWEIGRWAERLAVTFLQSRGTLVIRLADIEGGAPMAEGFERNIVLPDLQVIEGGSLKFYEVKWKRRPAWYAIRKQWRHGIDLSKWRHYQRIQRDAQTPVVLLILEHATGLVLSQSLHGIDSHVQVVRSFSRGFDGPMAFWPRSCMVPIGATRDRVTALPHGDG